MAPGKFLQIEPAVARGNLTDSMWKDPKYVIENKYDGDRRIAQFCGQSVRFTGRKQSVKDGLYVEKSENVPHLSNLLPSKLDVRLLPTIPRAIPPLKLNGTVLDGEMVAKGRVAGGQSKLVTSIMGSAPDKAIKKQLDSDWLIYVVFDCLFWCGRDVRGLPLVQRQEYADQAVRLWDNPYVDCAMQKQLDKRAFHDQVMLAGGEGTILKDKTAPYGVDAAWVKVKGVWTADVVIMGYKDAKEISRKSDGTKSETKYAKSGMIGAVVVGQYWPGNPDLIEVASISGMTDEERGEFTRHGDKYLGRVVRLEHNGREPTHRFRHPRFEAPIVFREDKAPKMCLIRPGEK